jgi:hypothetical protein
MDITMPAVAAPPVFPRLLAEAPKAMPTIAKICGAIGTQKNPKAATKEIIPNTIDAVAMPSLGIGGIGGTGGIPPGWFGSWFIIIFLRNFNFLSENRFDNKQQSYNCQRYAKYC